ncbi:MAG: hypothetical protein ACTH93_00855 [Pseudoclavibacter sp.]
MSTLSKTTLAALLAGTVLVGLSACSSSDSDKTSDQPAPQQTSDAPQSSASEEAQSGVDGASKTIGDYQFASWASESTAKGVLVGTVSNDTFKVDIYQVAVRPASKRGSFMTDDGKPLFEVGDPMAFYQAVVTNTSGRDLPASASLVQLRFHRDDNPYVQEDSVTDLNLLQELGIPKSQVRPNSGETTPDFGVTWKNGTSYADQTNIRFTEGQSVEVTATFTPALPDGKLDSANRVQTKGSFKMAPQQ